MLGLFCVQVFGQKKKMELNYIICMKRDVVLLFFNTNQLLVETQGGTTTP